MKQPPIPAAVGIAIAIVACIVAINLLPSNLLGVSSGWVFVLVLTAFLMHVQKISKEAVAKCVLGSLAGMAIGQFFTLMVPVFLALAVVLLTCKVSNRCQMVLNDYALLFMTVYTIPGAASPATVWHDAIFVLIFGVLAFAAVTVIEKKNAKSEASAE